MTQAPRFHLTAVGAARVIGAPPAVVPLVLLFHGRAGGDLAATINVTLRAQCPDPDLLLIASVVDLHPMPGFMRAPARLALETAYHLAARKVPPGTNPAEFVLILPDWDGSLTHTFGMQDRADVVGFVLIDQAWEITASHAGPNVLAAAQSLAQTISTLQPSSV